ncbi:50S ribosomal protein L20 [Candidatus Kaiserbacteria bacterium RIFCSPHIGHO2_02_FULL_59_21]|uniref:Large ribosomal subunit protein bL20 n=2 Tax=Candidatus Kaiseribacteriota TaxID=1752734 RepID=A0A0G2AWT2_9BACT|nr:MAG: 50S ribosomal protein L20 [Candidatus Kaiserbacteria bacterium GW2011_GWA2_58_9]OGG63009.1 MAG: 50S ribosomal protein L20 [Candidatus Kaiserbacteria bacterium RIFCSPHIGHO2_01_FULL_58_22]OGG66652.1 MAG: 50S ribosomal protein L20 [Candidatus Kaiserbacteria bacterium RIFCSPHIGHO2_02_FULL_59_21]OGG78973.1 MAG: 50S ribosomal protein L20 [Candidatus Kaiserbacteria bacterium RIFCSPLOWO2_01_FULL_59_34]OGG84403.1 MAG: 50S ribosomal protein L20 [Candidatus Kaiserbacteria bacterium RIFCSPLOWO2_02_
MARVKRGVTKTKRRKNILAQVKGYRFARSKKERAAKEAIFHAGSYAFRHRRAKKREFRNLWTLRINAAARPLGLSYSKLIGLLKKNNVGLDRKSLAALAMSHPEIFQRVVQRLAR